MKIVSGIILVLFVSFGQSVIINCDLGMSNVGDSVGIVYTCHSSTINTEILTMIEEVRSDHSNGKSNADVLAFEDHSSILQYFPTNLANFLPNLVVLRLYSPLLQLTTNDLKPYPNLIYFSASSGKFTNIDGDLFQHTRNLQQISFSGGKLENVGKNILSGLKLEYVSFSGNTCINL